MDRSEDLDFPRLAVSVVEVGSTLAVAQCGRMLVDAGADVTRIEYSEKTTSELDPDFLTYLHEGKNLRRLERESDVRTTILAEASAVDVLLCDTAEIATIARKAQESASLLIVAAVTSYGLDGPDAETPATDFTLQVESGIAAVHGTGARPPVVAGVPFTELVGAAETAVGMLNALLARDAGGRNIVVDVSKFESGIGVLQYPWHWETIPGHARYLLDPETRAAEGKPPFVLPANPIPCIERASDGWVSVVTMTPQQWSGFKAMVGTPALDDPRFDPVTDRALHAAEITALVEPFTSRHTIAELTRLGELHRVPVTAVGRPETVMDLPPYESREVFAKHAGGFLAPVSPIRYSAPWSSGADEDPDVHRPAPPASSLLPPISPESSPELPLRGLRVVEFGLFQAGPLATAHLAGMGAEVIKVESVQRPDLIRFAGLPTTVPQSWERSGTFQTPNVGKRAITADLGDPAGLEMIRRLLATADVVVENYAPRTLNKCGLDAAGMHTVNNDLITMRMPAWGLDGDWSNRPGFTQSTDAASGLSELTGYPDGKPIITGTVMDPYAATLATFATLVAVRSRQRTHQGLAIELALSDVAVQLTAQAVISASRSHRPVTRAANDSPGAAPQGIYRASDGIWLGISVTRQDQWEALARVVDARWSDDERFRTPAAREAHRRELDVFVAHACAAVGADKLVNQLRAAGVPAARLGSGPELIAHPQLLARERVYHVVHPLVGSLPYVGPAARLSCAPAASHSRPAPLFGADNHAVLKELGYSDGDIEAFRAAHLIGDSPYGLPLPSAG